MASSNKNPEALSTSLEELAELFHSAKFEKLLELGQDLEKANAQNPALLNLLGVANFKLGFFRKAATYYDRALRFDPAFATAHYNLGSVLHKLGRFDEAIKCYEKTISLDPNNADAHCNFGITLASMRRLEDAIEQFKLAIKLNPALSKAHHNLGNIFARLGRKEEAISSYRRTLELSPEFAEAHRALASVKKFVTYDNDVKAMELAFSKTGTNDSQKMHLAFGLAKSMEDLGSFDKAFEYMQIGNSIKRKSFNYSIEVEVSRTNSIIKSFDKEFFRTSTNFGFSDQTPIFIVGMPRSGTTLIEQILASHKDVFGGGELTYLREVVENLLSRNSSQVKPVDFLNAGKRYIESIKQLDPTTKHITDKLPINFQQIGMIKLILPNAKIIHCRRDPRDICLSIYKNYFSEGGNYYAYDLVELGKFYNLYKKLMRHWDNVIPNHVYHIQYEDIINDQKSETKSLLKFCDLDWDDACLQFYNKNREVNTASSSQVRNPIYRNSINLWKSYEKQLSPLLDILEQEKD